jgi:hypothetical protein
MHCIVRPSSIYCIVRQRTIQCIKDGQTIQYIEDGRIIQYIEDGWTIQYIEDGQTMLSTIVNCPFICNKVPTLPTYGVYISQLIKTDYRSGAPEFIPDL